MLGATRNRYRWPQRMGPPSDVGYDWLGPTRVIQVSVRSEAQRPDPDRTSRSALLSSR